MRKITLSTGGELLRNFVYLFFGNIGIRAISFLVTIIIARRIGTDAFGQLNLAQAFMFYFVVLADFGITLIAIREYVKSDKPATEFVGDVLNARIILGIVSFLMLVTFTQFNTLSNITNSLMLLFSYMIVVSVFSLEWYYRAIEDMRKVAVTGILHVLIPSMLLFIFVRNESDLMLIPIFFAVGGAIQLTIYWAHFLRTEGVPQLSLQPYRIYDFLRLTSLMGASQVMIQIYYNLDTILLGFISGEQIVGFYNAAYRLVTVFTAIAAVIGDAIFPRLSGLTTATEGDEANRQQIMSFGTRLLVYAVLPATVLISMYSGQIINLLYTDEYALSAPVLSIIIWQIFTVFANVAFAYNLLAIKYQRAYFLSVAAGAFINTLLNILLIPQYSMIGAAIATMVAEVLVLALLYYYASKLIVLVPIVGILWRVILLIAILVGIALAIENVFIGSFVGLVVYGVVLLATRPFTREEYHYFKLWS